MLNDVIRISCECMCHITGTSCMNCIGHVFSYRSDTPTLLQRIEKLESKLDALVSKSEVEHQKQPFKCPICNGKGSIRKEVEPRVLKLEFCNACTGKGVIWG